MSTKADRRVGCYIDGFNLYYGLRDSNYQRFYWLDLQNLANRLIVPGDTVSFVKYFTSRISGPGPSHTGSYATLLKDRRRRQSNYLEALQTHCTCLTVIEGHFLSQTKTCFQCQATWAAAEEKMTDVNIATEMIVDAFANRFDTALVVSADSDLVPPVRAVRECFGHKRVMVAFPPARNSLELKNAATGQFTISRRHLRDSQLPETVTKPNGYVLKRPDNWK